VPVFQGKRENGVNPLQPPLLYWGMKSKYHWKFSEKVGWKMIS